MKLPGQGYDDYRVRAGDDLSRLTEKQKQHFEEWSSLWGEALLNCERLDSLDTVTHGNAHRETHREWRNVSLSYYDSASSTLVFYADGRNGRKVKVKIRGYHVIAVAAFCEDEMSQPPVGV